MAGSRAALSFLIIADHEPGFAAAQYEASRVRKGMLAAPNSRRDRRSRHKDSQVNFAWHSGK
jgi:hypothetical protein